jgi:hypothetical protein
MGYRGQNYPRYGTIIFAGEQGCLRATLVLARQFSYYAVNVYFPSSMLVIVSWVSFWLDRAVIPARTALGVTTLLSMTTLVRLRSVAVGGCFNL